jgi:hypothetical protein
MPSQLADLQYALLIGENKLSAPERNRCHQGGARDMIDVIRSYYRKVLPEPIRARLRKFLHLGRRVIDLVRSAYNWAGREPLEKLATTVASS